MGLDMYLSAVRYASAYEFSKEEDRAVYRDALKAVGLSEENADESIPSCQVSITVAYWRKANQIHGWFVKNIQDGVDDCRDCHVEREQLEQLLAICKEVEADHGKAESLLPPQQWFFFGTYELDEWYFEGIRSTISQLERVLGNEIMKGDGWRFEYQSSW